MASEPIVVDGVQFFPALEVAREIGISRQTLWRWRQEKKVPQGHRYRNGQVLFSEDEVEMVREFANKIEPIEEDSGLGQMRLFGRLNGRSRPQSGGEESR